VTKISDSHGERHLGNEARRTCHILSCAACILNAQEHVNTRVGREGDLNIDGGEESVDGGF
jgi:hypothetical protein